MSEQREREIWTATERAMQRFREKPREEQVADLQRVGILDDQGVLSARYGGSGAMTWPEGAKATRS